jgi:hypothetical protein
MKAILTILLFFGISSYASESAFDTVTDTSVTDEEKLKSDAYIHQGIAAKSTKEMCEDGQGGYSDICTEQDRAFDKSSKLSKLEALVPALTKAYAMFNTMAALSGSGGGLTKSVHVDGKQVWQNGEGKVVEVNTQAGEAAPDGVTKKTEESQDYCSYIGMVGEAANTAYMAVQNDTTTSNYSQSEPEAAQAASFYAIADSHKSMKKASSVQFGTWSATAACYVAYATQASYTGDWKVYAKMGAAALIATYYKKKTDAHKERAEILTKMAKDLPQAGDCNPFTNKSCFCAEETSYAYDPTNYVNICVPKEIADRTGDLSNAFVCADENGKVDASCKCAKTNSCIDKKLKIAGINLGLKPIQLQDPLAALKPLSSGLITGDVNSAANKNLALANKALKGYNPSEAPSLSNAQKDLAKDFIKSGIPKAASIMMGKGSKPGASATPTSALSGMAKGSFSKFRSGNKNTLPSMKAPRVKSGGKIASSRPSSRNNAFGRFGKKNKRNTNAIQIEDFALKAEREAVIVKDSSKGIFDMISYRYKMSAWRQYKENLKSTK